MEAYQSRLVSTWSSPRANADVFYSPFSDPPSVPTLTSLPRVVADAVYSSLADPPPLPTLTSLPPSTAVRGAPETENVRRISVVSEGQGDSQRVTII
jgi:hypothetical protein